MPTRRRDEEEREAPHHLKCVACLSLPEHRVEQCKNGHLICAGGEGSCLARLRSDTSRRPTCPYCRTPLYNLARCLVAENCIACLPGTCKHCLSEFKRSELCVHEASCPKEKVSCSAEGCDWCDMRELRAEHERGCVRGRVGIWSLNAPPRAPFLALFLTPLSSASRRFLRAVLVHAATEALRAEVNDAADLRDARRQAEIACLRAEVKKLKRQRFVLKEILCDAEEGPEDESGGAAVPGERGSDARRESGFLEAEGGEEEGEGSEE